MAGEASKGEASVSSDERYVVISADCHGGGGLLDYREYLPRGLHDEFDAWAATYEIPYEDMTGPDGNRNWDSDRRLRELEDDGIVAEVVYPNTIPPFFPKASLADQPRAESAADQERRWAGLQAHNRWMADFCAAARGRRAGICQIMLQDVEAAVDEIRWAKDAGLTGGVLLPGAPPGSGVPPLYDCEAYEPIWSVCEELGMPVNHHSGSAAPPMGETDEDHVVFLLEVTWWAHRALMHLIVSGALERHPAMQLVFSEQGTAWIPEELARLDYFFDRMSKTSGSQELVWGLPVVERLSLKPSEYWSRQCHVAASFIRPAEAALRHQVGVDRMMWGSDYPHKEASYPWSLLALRAAFAETHTDELTAILTENPAELYGFDVEALRPLAKRFGPRMEEVSTPLRPGEVPLEATRCPAFAGLAGVGA